MLDHTAWYVRIETTDLEHRIVKSMNNITITVTGTDNTQADTLTTGNLICVTCTPVFQTLQVKPVLVGP